MTFYADQNSDNSSNSDESQEGQKGQDNRRMLADELFDSDSDEDTKRVVLSEKDKRYQKLRETIMNLKQSTERLNFASVEEQYDTLIKDFEKSKKVIEEHGIPTFFLRSIYVLEDRIKNFTAEEKKKLSSANSKAMNAILRKITKISSDIKEGLIKFAENPTPTTEESGGEKTDSDFNDDSSNDSIHPLESNDPMVRRQFWLKKKVVESESDDDSKKGEGDRKPKEKKVHEFKVAEVETEREITIDTTYDGRTNILKEFVANRTQKHFDLKYCYQVLKAYLKHYQTQEEINEEIITELIMILIPISVDYSKKIWISTSVNASCMNREMWLETFANIKELLKILKKPENRARQYQTYSKQEDNKFYPSANILESVSTFFCTIVVELNKAFQGIETQSEEQYNRIQDLYDLLRLSELIQNFYDSLDLPAISTRIAFLRLENMYYIHDSILIKVRAADTQTYEIGSYFHQDSNTEQIIHNLATLVYKNDEANKTKAILYHIYHHAIHDRTGVARDYLLMSKITDNVINIDSTLQTFYNRVLVQLGLAYFRQGNFTEAFTFLNDLCSQLGKTRELIGQAQLRFMGVGDRKKVLPQHQHINVEMVEIVNFTCSMLIEGPIIVQETHSKNVVARNFRRLLDSYNKSHFISPPEQNKDYIFYATKELQKGNWKGCYDNLIQMSIWKHLTGLESTLKNLLLRVKEQSFKSYLFQFKNTFENLSLNNLVEKFELDAQAIKAITFKMISAQELIARVHTIENQLYIIFEHSDRTSLQGLSSRLIECVNQSQNHNQRILDKKIGTIEQQFQDENTDNTQKTQQKGDGKTIKKKLNLVNNKPKTNKRKY